MVPITFEDIRNMNKTALTKTVWQEIRNGGLADLRLIDTAPLGWDEYGKTWRLWPRRPSDALREATPWV